MKNKKKIIRVRHGINGFKYSACDEKGRLIANLEKLADAHKHWLWEIRHNLVVLIRELDKLPIKKNRTYLMLHKLK